MPAAPVFNLLHVYVKVEIQIQIDIEIYTIYMPSGYIADFSDF